MKVYVVLVDYESGRDTKVHGVYKQYRHALQEEQRLLKDFSTLTKLYGVEIKIKVRIANSEVTE